jgi:hypothetical protein
VRLRVVIINGQELLYHRFSKHSSREVLDGPRPNVLRFSCRRGALHQKASKKPRSRAPKAVSCKRLLGGNAILR